MSLLLNRNKYDSEVVMISKYDYIHSSSHNKLNSDNRYHAAKELSYSLLQGTSPDYGVLVNIYDKQLVDTIRRDLDNFVNSKFFFNGTIRLHEANPPREISECRQRVKLDTEHFQPIQSMLLNYESPVPNIEMLQPIFGKFSYYVQENYIRLKEKSRKGFGPYAGHPNSVSFTVRDLFTPKIPNPAVDKDNILISIVAAALHDSLEELVNDLSNYDKFMSKLIPTETQDRVRILTNHYNMILDSAKKYFSSNQASPNKKMLIKYLRRSGSEYKSLSYYTDRLTKFLNEIDISYNNNSKSSLLKELKKPIYDKLYIIDFWDMSQKLNNYSDNEIKIIDLSDNGVVSNVLDFEGRINSSTKRQTFCDIGFSKENLPPHVKIHLRELQDNALTDAETIILQQILSQNDPQQEFTFTVNALVKLYPVLFTNYPQK